MVRTASGLIGLPKKFVNEIERSYCGLDDPDRIKSNNVVEGHDC